MTLRKGRQTVRMVSGATLQIRRCRNKADHTPHRWRGLNTRHHGYFCYGVGEQATASAREKALDDRWSVA